MDKKAFLKYLAALLLFGLNGIVASHIALSSYEIVFLRTCIGSILLVGLFLLGKGKFHTKVYKKDTLFIVLSGTAMGTSWMFLYEAYQQIGVSMASLLYYCGPVIVMVLSPIIFKEKLTLSKICGFLVVLVGIVLVNGTAAEAGGNTWGLICGAMSAVMYFFMVTLNKQAKNITGMENSVIQLVGSFHEQPGQGDGGVRRQRIQPDVRFQRNEQFRPFCMEGSAKDRRQSHHRPQQRGQLGKSLFQSRLGR